MRTFSGIERCLAAEFHHAYLSYHCSIHLRAMSCHSPAPILMGLWIAMRRANGVHHPLTDERSEEASRGQESVRCEALSKYHLCLTRTRHLE